MRVPIIMAGAEESKGMKREHEPITMVCFVVLLLACAIVIGTWASDQISGDSSETVQYGDSVTIDYTGSLYAYYDQGTDEVKPVIFDTTLSSVGKNSNNLFVSSFNKTSFGSTAITLGAGKFLSQFEEALMGKKVGDTVRVPAFIGYHAAVENKLATSGSFTQINSFNMSLSEIKSFFGYDGTISALVEFTYDGMKESVSGDPVVIRAIPNGNSYQVSYNLVAGKDYEVYNTALGKVMLHVDTAGYDLAYTLTVDPKIDAKDAEGDPAKVKVGTTEYNAIEMIGLKMFPKVICNIVGVDGSNIIYNAVTDSTAIISGIDLYFVVKIVSKN